ncbi:MAG: S24/S26 family peptidase [Firmicutes bacterium]|nr:S24/S26 family peptidase [Alicyclobacillaceae bacterium]MCL6497009.1 S24/S26 family peptidase [Bacillota bacterium]
MIATALIAAFWYTLAPPQLGGKTTILLVQGTSMLPRFHAGDLVVVRQAAHYTVGTLAAYHYVPFHSIFFHQIIARVDGRYVFQGINNPVADNYHPTRQQIIGRLWFALPGVGSWFIFWRQPMHAALLVGALALVTTLTAPRRRRRMGRVEQKAPLGLAAAGSPGPWWILSGALATVAAASLAISGWSYTHPLTTVQSRPITYSQSVHFDYQAQVAKSVLYPLGKLRPGDPVYVPPVEAMTVGLQYQLDLRQGQVLGGTAGLDAEIVSTSGWHYRYPLISPRRFTGASTALSVALDPTSVLNTVSQVTDMTQDQLDTYQLRLIPMVRATALSHGKLFSAQFDQPIAFDLNKSWLRLQVPDTISLNQYLNPVSTGSSQYSQVVPNALTAFGLAVPLSQTRRYGPLATTLFLLGAGLAWWWGQRVQSRLDPASRIAQRYASILVDVDHLPFSPFERSIQVGSIDGLVRLALQCERMILHAKSGEDLHLYLLENVGESYYYVVPASASSPLPQAHLQSVESIPSP